MRTARDYQAEDIEKIFEEFKEAKSTLYVAATGLGKTFVMTEVARRMLPGRTLLLAHRNELITQAREAFIDAGMDVEIEKAELTASTSLFNCAPVVIASVQTMLSGNDDWQRMQRFKPTDFALLLYDEVHHAVSPGNKKIVDYFINGNPDLKVLGVTATPDRADEEALGKIFQTVASERDILWANKNGWLVDPRQKMIHIDGLDFSEMRTVGNDLSSGDLAAVMESESCVQGVAQPTLETLYDLEPNSLSDIPTADWESFLKNEMPGHRAIVFTVTVAQAETLSNIFNRVVPGLAAWICGKTKEEDRTSILKRFKEGGDVRILVNVGVTTEGYDNPAVDLIVMARPTKSRSLYCQCLGRGTRPVPGLVDMYPTAAERVNAILNSQKPCVIVLDFVGNSGRHKLISTADILGGNFSEAAVAKAVEKVKNSAVPVMMTEALMQAQAELEAEMEARRLAEEARKARVLAKVKYTMTIVSPFDVFALQPQRERGWDEGKTLTEKQRAVLLKQGVDPSGMSYTQQKQVLNEIFRRFSANLCSFKQSKVLQKAGIKQPGITRDQASKLIDALAKNYWKPLPPDVVKRILEGQHRSN